MKELCRTVTGMRFKKIRTAFFCAAALSAAFLSACSRGTAPTSYEDGIEALRTGDYTTADTLFRTAIDVDGRAAEGHRGQGIIAVRQERYEDAIEYFNMALEEIPSYKNSTEFREDILFYQAEAYHRSGQPDRAMSNYNRLLEGKNSGRAYLLRGKLYAEEGKFGQAGQDFRKAVERDSDYEVYLQIYEVYTSNNRQADGAAFLKEGMKKKPSSPEEYYELGRISYVLGDYAQAKTYLERAVKEDVSGALTLLGRVYLEEDDVEKARALFLEGASAEATQGVGYNGLALCALYENQYDEAINYIKSGMATLNGNVKEALRFNEIVAYECKLDFETAAARMESFLKLYPENEDALRENIFIQSRLVGSYAAPPPEENSLQPVGNSTDSSVDLDGDGIPEGTDADGDGILDEGVDADGDGYLDSTWDRDGDGYIDTVWDLDGDGILDGGVDLDGDGIIDSIAYNTGAYDDGTYSDGTYDDGTYDQGTYYDDGTYYGG